MPQSIDSLSKRPDGASPLDPEIGRFQRLMEAGYASHPPLDSVSTAEARRIAEAVRAPFTAGGPVMARTYERVFDDDPAGAPPVRVRVHLPSSGAPAPALVYLHGGGWTFFSLDTHDRLMREYADRAGIAVVGVDYALSPEVRYPVALDQVCAVMSRLAAGALPDVDGTRLAVGGDSAGGNLALATAMRLRDAPAGRSLRAMVLNYGAYGRSVDSDSYRRYGGPGYVLDSNEMLVFWRNYLGDFDGAKALAEPLAEPLRAPLDELIGLPPAFFAVAECDVLHDDSIDMADRLRQAQVDTTLTVYPGAAHGFLEAMSLAAISRRALDDTATWLRRQLSLPNHPRRPA